MASSFCHVVGVAMRFRLERIVRPLHCAAATMLAQPLQLLSVHNPRYPFPSMADANAEVLRRPVSENYDVLKIGLTSDLLPVEVDWDMRTILSLFWEAGLASTADSSNVAVTACNLVDRPSSPITQDSVGTKSSAASAWVGMHESAITCSLSDSRDHCGLSVRA